MRPSHCSKTVLVACCVSRSLSREKPLVHMYAEKPSRDAFCTFSFHTVLILVATETKLENLCCHVNSRLAVSCRNDNCFCQLATRKSSVCLIECGYADAGDTMRPRPE